MFQTPTNFSGENTFRPKNGECCKRSSGRVRHEYFYDGVEEAFLKSDDEQTNDSEDDERLLQNDDRASFTREQLVEYQQLIKLFRFVKVRCHRRVCVRRSTRAHVEWRPLHNHSLVGAVTRSEPSRSKCLSSLQRLVDHQRDAQFSRDVRSGAEGRSLSELSLWYASIQLNALHVLNDACQNGSLAYEVFRLGGIMTIIDSMCLDHTGIAESCAILQRLLQFRRARKVIRRSGGISKLVSPMEEASWNA